MSSLLPTLPQIPDLLGETNSGGQPIQLGPGITGTFHGDPSTLDNLQLSQGGIEVPAAPARPNQQGQGLGTQSGGNWFSDMVQGIGRAVGGVTGSKVDQTKLDAAASASSISWSRSAAFVVGLICIGAGLLMFRQTQIVVGEFAKGVAKGAAAAV